MREKRCTECGNTNFILTSWDGGRTRVEVCARCDLPYYGKREDADGNHKGLRNLAARRVLGGPRR